MLHVHTTGAHMAVPVHMCTPCMLTHIRTSPPSPSKQEHRVQLQQAAKEATDDLRFLHLLESHMHTVCHGDLGAAAAGMGPLVDALKMVCVGCVWVCMGVYGCVYGCVGVCVWGVCMLYVLLCVYMYDRVPPAHHYQVFNKQHIHTWYVCPLFNIPPPSVPPQVWLVSHTYSQDGTMSNLLTRVAHDITHRAQTIVTPHTITTTPAFAHQQLCGVRHFLHQWQQQYTRVRNELDATEGCARWDFNRHVLFGQTVHVQSVCEGMAAVLLQVVGLQEKLAVLEGTDVVRGGVHGMLGWGGERGCVWVYVCVCKIHIIIIIITKKETKHADLPKITSTLVSRPSIHIATHTLR